MSDRKTRISAGICITALGLAAASAVSYFTTKQLVSVGMDRNMPERAKNKDISKTKKSEEVEMKINEAAEKLENAGLKEINIKSRDGKRLCGHLYYGDDDKRIIIAMHGWRSSWSKDFGAISDFWHKSGSAVLYAEQRGQNNSEGEYMGFGMVERFDCLCWIEWVREHNEKNLPIYLAGISMGAATVLMASGSRPGNDVHGIIADCGFTSAEAVWKHVIRDNMHMPYRVRSRLINDLCKRKIEVGLESYTVLEAMKTNSTPVLFIHGTDDSFVPVEMTFKNYKACNAPKELFIVPGAGHALCYIEDKEGYERAVSGFFEKYD